MTAGTIVKGITVVRKGSEVLDTAVTPAHPSFVLLLELQGQQQVLTNTNKVARTFKNSVITCKDLQVQLSVISVEN